MRELSESYLMNINLTGFRCFKDLCILVLWTEAALASEGLTSPVYHLLIFSPLDIWFIGMVISYWA